MSRKNAPVYVLVLAVPALAALLAQATPPSAAPAPKTQPDRRHPGSAAVTTRPTTSEASSPASRVDANQPPANGSPPLWRYKCDPDDPDKGCGHEWETSAKDMQKYLEKKRGSRDPSPADEAYILRVECPKCGKNTGWKENQCPACKKWFIPADIRTRYEDVLKARDSGPPTSLKCPYCGIDIRKWYIDHATTN